MLNQADYNNKQNHCKLIAGPLLRTIWKAVLWNTARLLQYLSVLNVHSM